jgi:hypothetical protein
MSLKSIQWEPSCSMRTDRRTDRQKDGSTETSKLIVAFRNFANAPKKLVFVTQTPSDSCNEGSFKYHMKFVVYRVQ